MRRVVSNFCARRPNVRAAGKATTCVSNNASNKLVLSRPSAVPYAVARSIMCKHHQYRRRMKLRTRISSYALLHS